MRLYAMPSSGNSYKVRLLLSHLGLPCEIVAVEQGSDALAEAQSVGRLPMGKVPVLLTETGEPLAESNAILCYLAEGTGWLPDQPLPRARVMAWMFFEQNRHETSIAVRGALRTYPERAHLATPERMAALLEAGHEALGVMDRHLAGRDWLEGTAPSVADIALYGYTHSAGPAGGFDMERFPQVGAWLDRMAALPGHVRREDLA